MLADDELVAVSSLACVAVALMAATRACCDAWCRLACAAAACFHLSQRFATTRHTSSPVPAPRGPFRAYGPHQRHPSCRRRLTLRERLKVRQGRSKMPGMRRGWPGPTSAVELVFALRLETIACRSFNTQSRVNSRKHSRQDGRLCRRTLTRDGCSLTRRLVKVCSRRVVCELRRDGGVRLRLGWGRLIGFSVVELVGYLLKHARQYLQ